MNVNLALRTVALFLLLSTSAQAQGNAFTYQGSLTDGATPANGLYDLQFTIHDSLSAGALVAGPVTNAATSVSNGLFTVTLEFGPGIFTGPARWLEIGVRTNGAPGGFSVLAPRQALTASPYAITAENLTGVVPNGGVAGTYLNVVTFSNTANSFRGTFSGSGAGLNSLNASQLTTGTLQDARLSSAVAFRKGDQTFTGTNTFTQPVGISTLNPQGDLQVNGGIIATSFQGRGAVLWEEVITAGAQAQPNRGYLANHPTKQVVVTLNASPAVGDVLRVAGVSTDGWKIAQTGIQSIRTSSLPPITGATWVAGTNVQNWSGVASTADGVQLVAIVYGGRIQISTNSGLTWVARGFMGNWTGVASSADGTKLAAVTDGGGIHTSTNAGLDWNAQGTPGSAWNSIASSADGTRLIASLRGGGVWLSTNSGLGWHEILPSAFNGVAVSSSTDGTRLAAVGTFFDSSVIYISTDSGINWNDIFLPSDLTAITVSSDGNKFAVASDDGIYTSADAGVTWILHSLNADVKTIASSADGTKLVAAAAGGKIYTSDDSGFTWVARESIRNWTAVASSADGKKLIAVVGNDRSFTSGVPSTTTPGPAGSLVGGPDSAIELIYVGNGQFRILSHEGTLDVH